MWQIIDTGVSFAFVTVLFGIIYKILPDVQLTWRDVATGATITSLLFTAGKFLIGFYLGHATFSSTYGAAGSFITLLVWVYYSALIFFFWSRDHAGLCNPVRQWSRALAPGKTNEKINLISRKPRSKSAFGPGELSR